MRIALIGMPTAGKSTISNLISVKCGLDVVDLDGLLEKRFNKSLQSYINEQGERKFIKEENEVMLNTEYPENCVISTGGSVIYAKEGMGHFKKLGIKIFYLSVPFEVLEKRLSSQRDVRGIVMNGAKNWRELLKVRDKMYHYYSDEIIFCEGKTEEKIVEKIMTKIK